MVHHHRLRDKLAPPARPAAATAPPAPELQSSLSALLGSASKTLAEHPKTSLAAALAAGMVVGWILKRR